MFHRTKFAPSRLGAGSRLRRFGNMSQPTDTVDPNLPTDAIGHWLLDEGAGTSTADNSGNGHTGTLTNGPTWETGKVGNYCAGFDGVNDHILIADSDDFSFTDGAGNDEPFSVSLWVYYIGGTSTVGIMAKGQDFSALVEWGLFIDSADDKLALQCYKNSGSNWIGRETGSAIAKNAWTHVLVTYDGSEAWTGIKLYVNGTDDSGGNTSLGTYTGMTNTADPLTIGAFWVDDTTYDSYIEGRIDDVYIFDRVVNSLEITALYNRGA